MHAQVVQYPLGVLVQLPKVYKAAGLHGEAPKIDVLRHREVFHQLMFLVHHAEPCLDGVQRAFKVDLLAVQDDLPLVRGVDAG